MQEAEQNITVLWHDLIVYELRWTFLVVIGSHTSERKTILLIDKRLILNNTTNVLEKCFSQNNGSLNWHVKYVI